MCCRQCVVVWCCDRGHSWSEGDRMQQRRPRACETPSAFCVDLHAAGGKWRAEADVGIKKEPQSARPPLVKYQSGLKRSQLRVGRARWCFYWQRELRCEAEALAFARKRAAICQIRPLACPAAGANLFLWTRQREIPARGDVTRSGPLVRGMSSEGGCQ